MLKLLALFFSLAHAQSAVNNNTYLVLSTPAGAQTRSQRQCAALGCDGVLTIWWWNVVSLTDGTGAVEIQPSGAFGKTTTAKACAVGCGLTSQEQASLKTSAQLGNLLPASSAQ